MPNIQRLVPALILCVFLAGFFSIRFWTETHLGGDSWGYYSYLPAAFIHHDLGNYERTVAATRLYRTDFEDPLKDKYGLYHQHPETGRNVIKYTSGVSMLLSPFFALTHLYVRLSGGAADGFSPAYGLGLGLGVVVWVMLGLLALGAVLLRYFSARVVYTVLAVLALATNLYYNVTYVGVMSHGLLFSLYSLLIYLTDTYYRTPRQREAWLIGLVCGLIALTRMNELYCILIPLLWGVGAGTGLGARLGHWLKHPLHLGGAVLLAGLVFVPQIWYWKTLTGDWVFNGYIGEKFDFKNPHILKGMFGFDNGWLPWTPVMLLVFPGFIFLRRYAAAAIWPTLSILPLHLYIVYSWWCWYYINGFGSRPMEHVYPLLAFSLASLLEVSLRGRWLRPVVWGFLILCAVLNIRMIHRIRAGYMTSSHANRAFYWTALLRPFDQRSLLIAQSSGEWQPANPTRIDQFYATDFEDTTQYRGASSLFKTSGNFSRRTSETNPVFKTIFPGELKGAKYLKISAQVRYEAEVPYTPVIWERPLLYIQWRDKNEEKIRERDSGVHPFQFIGNTDYSLYHNGVPGQWSEVSFFVRVPYGACDHGILAVWNGNNNPFFIDDLKVELYRD
jgi:hypothetical protein